MQKDILALLELCIEYCRDGKNYKDNRKVANSKSRLAKKVCNYFYDKTHCHPKVKVQPALLLSSFVHNSSINELKNMKLSEHIYYEMTN